MKNKKNIYFLVPAVLFIWGIIGYKIYATINPSDDTVMTKNTTLDFKPEEIKEVEKFTINANYRDPFLGKSEAIKATKHVSNKIAPIIEFPSIIYKGMIAPKQSNRTTIFLVTINNAQQFLSIGKQVDGVKLLNGNSKEITISFQKTKKTVPIQ